MELITTSYWDLGFNISVYVRFSLDLKGGGLRDDLITIEYFASLEDAQAGFTENQIIYQQYLGYRSSSFYYGIFFGSLAGLVVVITAIVTIVVVRKKKEK